MKTTYNPTPTQKEFHDCKIKEVLFGGGRGSGKSSALLADAVKWSEEHPHSEAWLFYPDKPTREYSLRFLWPTLGKEGLDLPHCLARFPNQSILHFPLCPRQVDPYEYAGMYMDWIGFDNLEDFSIEAFAFLRKRITLDAVIRCTASLHPLTPLWVPMHFIGDPDRKIISAYMKDNPYINPEYLAKIKESYHEN